MRDLALLLKFQNIIIALYGMAISQYKTYRCPRTRRHLVLQMADEYYNSKDYGKSLTWVFLLSEVNLLPKKYVLVYWPICYGTSEQKGGPIYCHKY